MPVLKVSKRNHAALFVSIDDSRGYELRIAGGQEQTGDNNPLTAEVDVLDILSRLYQNGVSLPSSIDSSLDSFKFIRDVNDCSKQIWCCL